MFLIMTQLKQFSEKQWIWLKEQIKDNFDILLLAQFK